MKKQLGNFLLAILAGLCIGLGGGVFLALAPENRIVGAVLFTVGLFTICIFGFALFTGRVCALFDNKPSYLITLAVIWAGNLVGAWAIGALVRLTRLGAGFSQTALSLCQTKLSDSFLSLFLLGFICNLLIYIAVEGFKNAPHDVGKYLAMLFGVSVFILTGTEHSVADMYYFSAAGILWRGDSLACILTITLGNACGGVFIPLVRKAAAKLIK
jgi:formate/nitrite transporter FocA (FNT family)